MLFRPCLQINYDYQSRPFLIGDEIVDRGSRQPLTSSHGNRRDASRNERFYKDCTALSLDELDAVSIKHHFEKINSDIAIAELLQNAILGRLKRGDEKKEENEHHNYHCNMLATRKGLTQQLTAAYVFQQSGLAKLSMDSFAALQSLTSYGTEKALTELGTTLATL